MLKALTLFFIFHIMIYENETITNEFCKNLRENRKQTCEKIYVWSNDRKDFISLFNVTFSGTHMNDLKSLKEKIVRVVADNMLPYITSSNYSQNLGGYLGDIWKIIQETYKFKYVVRPVSYDVGLEMIESGEADVMLAAVVVKEGLKNVFYSQPYFYNWYHLYLKSPKVKASTSSYLNTFSTQLWIFSCILFAILTMSVWLTSKFLNRAYLLEPHISIPSCFLGIVSGFINQGFDLKLRSYSGRIQVMIALVFGVVLYSAMNAVLVAQLAVFDIPYPFQSLRDIAKKRTHSLCLRSNSFVYNNFTDENKEILSLWKGTLNNKDCLDINYQENISKIICNNNIIILENRVIMSSLHKNYPLPCQVISFPEKYFMKGNSFLMVKSFAEKFLIDNFVKRMRSTGVLQRLEDKWVRRDKLVDVNIQQSSNHVTLGHIIGVLYFYLIAVFISLAILVVEILYSKYFSFN